MLLPVSWPPRCAASMAVMFGWSANLWYVLVEDRYIESKTVPNSRKNVQSTTICDDNGVGAVISNRVSECCAIPVNQKAVSI
jgi:hypothetical protein